MFLMTELYQDFLYKVVFEILYPKVAIYHLLFSEGKKTTTKVWIMLLWSIVETIGIIVLHSEPGSFASI